MHRLMRFEPLNCNFEITLLHTKAFTIWLPSWLNSKSSATFAFQKVNKDFWCSCYFQKSHYNQAIKVFQPNLLQKRSKLVEWYGISLGFTFFFLSFSGFWYGKFSVLWNGEDMAAIDAVCFWLSVCDVHSFLVYLWSRKVHIQRGR